MHDRFEILASRRIAEHNRPKLRAIHRAVRREDVGAESRRDGGRRFSPGGFDAVRQRVGVEGWDAVLAKLLEHVTLAGCNTVGQRNSKHRPTFFTGVRSRPRGDVVILCDPVRLATYSSAAWRS